MRRFTIMMVGLALTGAASAQGLQPPGAAPLSRGEQALARLIEHASLSKEPAVTLLSGLADLPDGTYDRRTIQRAIDNMDAFARLPQGTEAEVLAIFDRWAAIDETLGKTNRIVKRGDRLKISRQRPQTLPFRGGRIELEKEISLRYRVAGPDARKASAGQLDHLGPGVYVQVDEIQGVKVEGGELDQFYAQSEGGKAVVSYFVKSREVGIWRRYAFGSQRPRRTPKVQTGNKGDFEVALPAGVDRLPLRADPERTSPALTMLEPGTRVDVLSEADAPWWQVRVGRLVGYVREEALADTRAAARAPYVVQLRYGLTALPMRAEPGKGGAELGRLAEGTAVELVSRARHPWWKVAVGGRTGYVHADHLVSKAARLGVVQRLRRGR